MLKIRGEVYLNASEASERLGKSRVTFYKRYRDNLKAFKIGNLKRVYYKASDLDKLPDSLDVVELVA